MSDGGNGDYGEMDLGFEIPEHKELAEKIEQALPEAGELQDKVSQRIADEIEDTGEFLRDKQLEVIGQIGKLLGDSRDRQERLNGKLLPALNNQLAASQVPALEINREADLLFNQILADRAGNIEFIRQRVPQYRALLFWVWTNKVKQDFKGFTKDNFKEIADRVWAEAIDTAKSGGVRNISAYLKEAETTLEARENRCPEGQQWVPDGPNPEDGYCTPISDPIAEQAEQAADVPQEPVIVGSDDKPVIVIGEDTPVVVPADHDSKWAGDIPETDKEEFGPYGDVNAAISFYGPGPQLLPFGPGCLQIPKPPVNRSQLPRLPFPYDWWSDSNGLTKLVSTPPNYYLIAYNKNDERPYQISVCWDEVAVTTEEELPPVTTELVEETEEDYCPPPWCPTIELNCVTGLAATPVVPPLDCDPADPACAAIHGLPTLPPPKECQEWFVFYSPDDQGCYYRCDNSFPIRPNDALIDSAGTKAEADQMIAIYCKDKGVKEIYYPTITPRPYATPVDFPPLVESYFCKIGEWVKTFIDSIIAPSSDPASYEAGQKFLAMMGINERGKIPALDNIMSDKGGIAGQAGDMIGYLLSTIYKNGVTWLVQIIQSTAVDRRCFSGTWTTNFYLYTFWGILEQWISGSFTQLKQQSMYRTQAECPQLMPELEPAIEMFLSGKIDNKELQALTRLNNYCFDPIEKLVEARETRYTTQELLALRMRGQIDEKQWDYEIRRNGYLERDAGTRLWDLHRAIPPMSDLVRMMVRDVADDKIVKKYGWEKQFGDKWTGDVKRWSKEQGINEYIARAYWYAHWQMPAPSQLFEMMHRLSRLDPADPAYTDMATIDEAMRVNDWPDYWITRFKAISFRRLTRVDVRRAYMIGSIDRAAVVESYQQLGYTNANANVLADFAETLLINRLEKSKDVRLYKSGVIDKPEALRRLISDGASHAQATDIVDQVDDELTAEVAEKCAAATKKQFLDGSLTLLQTEAALLGFGIALPRVNHFIAAWTCELVAQDKKPTTAQLCKFKEQGLIADPAFITALEQLGWDPLEVQNIIKSCDIKIADKQARAVAKAAREQLARQKQQVAAIQKVEKQSQAEQEKQRRQQERARKARESSTRANLKRQSVLVKASDKVAELYGIDLEEALYLVNETWRAIKREFGYDSNKATEIIKVGVASLDKKELIPFPAHITIVAQGYAAMEV